MILQDKVILKQGDKPSVESLVIRNTFKAHRYGTIKMHDNFAKVKGF